MCYDVSLHSDIEITKKAFPQIKDRRKDAGSNYPNMEHITSFAFPKYPVIINNDGEIQLVDMQWSVDPFFEKDPKARAFKRTKMANARSERVIEDKRSMWYRLRQNHCLIPLSGTYEHREIIGWDIKVPYYIWLEGREGFHVPGLYQIREGIDEDGNEINEGSFTMLTRPANDVMKEIHNSGEFKHRMPLFLTPELEQYWLSNNLTDDNRKAVFEFELPSENLEYRTVYSVRGRKPRPDGKHKYDLWTYENLPSLGDDEAPKVQGTIF